MICKPIPRLCSTWFPCPLTKLMHLLPSRVTQREMRQPSPSTSERKTKSRARDVGKDLKENWHQRAACPLNSSDCISRTRQAAECATISTCQKGVNLQPLGNSVQRAFTAACGDLVLIQRTNAHHLPRDNLRQSRVQHSRPCEILLREQLRKPSLTKGSNAVLMVQMNFLPSFPSS